MRLNTIHRYVPNLRREDFLSPDDADFFLGLKTTSKHFFEKYSGPAAFFIYAFGKIHVVQVNERYLAELGGPKEEDVYDMDPWVAFDESSKSAYEHAILKAIDSCDEESCDTWRMMYRQSCGGNHVCIRSTVRLIASNGVERLMYAVINDVTAEKKEFQVVCDNEAKFKAAAEHANTYAWEYSIDTKEMRPCYRCMRDLGMPALLENYPEPVIENGIFPLEFADTYRQWHEDLARGVKSLEAIVPLTANRVPFHVRYTNTFDKNGRPVKAYGSATMVVDDVNSDIDKKVVVKELKNIMDLVSASDNSGNDSQMMENNKEKIQKLLQKMIVSFSEEK